MKLTTRMSNGRLKVNKAAVIEKLRKALKKTREAKVLGTIPVSPREVESEFNEMTRYNAESLLNKEEI